jgi:hypothetical protein
MKRSLGKIWPVLLIVALSSSGCGIYSTSSGRVSEAIRRMAVPYLVNDTSEPNIGVELTDAIIRDLKEGNILQVVDEEHADSILRGHVVRYDLREAFATAEQRVNEYQVQIMVELDLVVRATGEKIFSKKRLTGTGNYILGEPGRDEQAAREEAASEIVREVTALVVEDW